MKRYGKKGISHNLGFSVHSFHNFHKLLIMPQNTYTALLYILLYLTFHWFCSDQSAGWLTPKKIPPKIDTEPVYETPVYLLIWPALLCKEFYDI